MIYIKSFKMTVWCFDLCMPCAWTPRGNFRSNAHSGRKRVAVENRWQREGLINFEREKDAAESENLQKWFEDKGANKEVTFNEISCKTIHVHSGLYMYLHVNICGCFFLWYLYLSALSLWVCTYVPWRCCYQSILRLFLILFSQQMDGLLQTSQEAISPNSIWSDTSPRLTTWP